MDTYIVYLKNGKQLIINAAGWEMNAYSIKFKRNGQTIAIFVTNNIVGFCET